MAELASTLGIRRLSFVALSWYLIPATVGLVLVAFAAERPAVWRGVAVVAAVCTLLSVLTLVMAARVGLGAWWIGPIVCATGCAAVSVGAVLSPAAKPQPATTTSE